MVWMLKTCLNFHIKLESQLSIMIFLNKHVVKIVSHKLHLLRTWRANTINIKFSNRQYPFLKRRPVMTSHYQ